MSKKVNVGDIFCFFIQGLGYGYGQVLKSNILQFVTIFDLLTSDSLDFIDPNSLRPVLSGWTMDARFHSGEWTIIGNFPPVDFQYPEYKVEFDGTMWVTDVDGKFVRLCRPEDIKSITYKFSDSPIAFENAFRAYQGELPWEPRFDGLRVK